MICEFVDNRIPAWADDDYKVFYLIILSGSLSACGH